MNDVAEVIRSAIGSILERDLNTLRREVEAYSDEEELWRTMPGIANSGGTLVLHLTGNLQHYFGTCLGKSSYRRDRPAEFTRRNVSRGNLLREIEAARDAVRTGLNSLPASQLTGEFPEAIADSKLTTAEYLVHLTTHFAYHLGQIDYHRRAVSGNPTVVGAMRPSELSSARPADVRA